MTEHELIEYGVSVGWLTPEKAEELKKLLEPKWIPVTEALPKNNEIVFCCNDKFGEIGFGAYNEKDKNNFRNGWRTDKNIWQDPSHWMPLPSLPIGAEKESWDLMTQKYAVYKGR